MNEKEKVRLYKKLMAMAEEGRSTAKPRLYLERETVSALEACGVSYTPGESFVSFRRRNVAALAGYGTTTGRLSKWDSAETRLATLNDDLNRFYCHAVQKSLASTPIWFEPEVSLARALMETSIEGVTEKEINLPVPAMLVLLPTELSIRLDSPPMRGESMYFFDGGITTGPKTPEDPVSVTARVFHAGLDVVDEEKTLLSSLDEIRPGRKVKLGVSDSTRWWQFVALPGEDLEEAITGIARNSEGGLDVLSLTRLCINLVLFMTTEQADIREPSPGALYRRERSWMPTETKTFQVGTKVMLDDEFKRPVAKGMGEGHPLRYRTLVRGHFRNQAYGPRHSLRKRKWIHPHFRGLDHPEPTRGHDYCPSSKKRD